jgi:spore germination protein KC
MADTIIIGEKLAELDSGLFTDLLLRNPRLRYNVQLFVAKGVFPSEILEAEVFPEDYSGTALENIIDNQRGQAGIYIPVDIKDFLFKTGTAGIEPVLPQIIMEKSENQAKLKLQGTAVFKGRQMVGSLDEQQTRGLALLNPKSIHRTVFNIKSPGHGEETSELKLYDTMAMELTSYQIQVKPLINGNNITMNIIMEAKGNIIEDNNNHNISDPEMVSSIEREAARVLRQYIHSCIEQAQSLNSDILGWGLAISRSHPKTWMEIEASWPDMFAGISSNIQVKYELQQSYLLNDAFPFK